MRVSIATAFIACISFVFPSETCRAQVAAIGSTSIRPFVVAFIPVIGRGGRVGGVSIDARGVVSRAEVDEHVLLASAHTSTLPSSKLRMVSLNRVEAALAEYLKDDTPIPEELLFLGGLRRVEYLFALPDERDLIVAGPAEPWRIDPRGAAVGRVSGQPMLRLDDLLEAFRTASLAKERPGITCSIDPTEEGRTNLQRLLRSRGFRFNAQTAELMRQAVGPQQITLTGVLPDSHFARVMVAADYLMKRLAMGSEESPVTAVKDYFDLAKAGTGRRAQTSAPRWWLAVNYERLLRSEDGLAWQVRGPGVQVQTEDAVVDRSGRIIDSGERNRPAERWAQLFTEHYGSVSKALPVFGELRNCMDLAVIAALITHYDLKGLVGAELPRLTGATAIRGPRYRVPTAVDSSIRVARGQRGWIAGVSGGVDLDSWSVLQSPEIGQVNAPDVALPERGWWWDPASAR